MGGQQKCLLVCVGAMCVSAAVVVVTLMLALGSHRELAAWVILGAVVLVPCVWAVSKLNEVVLRHKRYYHQQETPLDQDGYPLYLQPGEQVYQHPASSQPDEYIYQHVMSQPKDGYWYER